MQPVNRQALCLERGSERCKVLLQQGLCLRVRCVETRCNDALCNRHMHAKLAEFRRIQPHGERSAAAVHHCGQAANHARSKSSVILKAHGCRQLLPGLAVRERNRCAPAKRRRNRDLRRRNTGQRTRRRSAHRLGCCLLCSSRFRPKSRFDLRGPRCCWSL